MDHYFIVWGQRSLVAVLDTIVLAFISSLQALGPYDLDLKMGVDFGLKNSVYLDLNSFALSNFDLKPKLCQQCT